MATSDKDHDRNRDRERDRSKMSNNRHGSDQPRGCSPQCRDHDSEHSRNGKCERSCGHESPFDNCKTKQRCGVSASPLRG